MVDRSTVRLAAYLTAAALATMALVRSGVAASHEQIVEQCRETARPHVMACVQARVSGRGGDRDAAIAACRESVGRPIVMACVRRAEQGQAQGSPPPAAPREETAKALPHDAGLVKPAFVAPPRTIADITAILDGEKPDPAKIAERRANADAMPPTNASPAVLAQFYYDRGNARALLGRNKDALADGLQAVAVAKGAIAFRQDWRTRQFVALQYRASGDPKQAISVFESMVREGNQPGRFGSMIDALSNLAGTWISVGDVAQAGTYAGRVEALVQEARGSPNPNWRSAYGIYGHSWEADNDSVRGLVFEARGQYAEAETAYRRAEAFRHSCASHARCRAPS